MAVSFGPFHHEIQGIDREFSKQTRVSVAAANAEKKALFGLGSVSADIDITLTGEDDRKLVEVKVDKDKRSKFPLYFDGESVGGRVNVRVREGKKLDHNGIKIEFVGQIGTLHN